MTTKWLVDIDTFSSESLGEQGSLPLSDAEHGIRTLVNAHDMDDISDRDNKIENMVEAMLYG